MAQRVKDLALLLLWLRFHPYPGNFHMLRTRQKKKKKEKKKEKGKNVKKKK